MWNRVVIAVKGVGKLDLSQRLDGVTPGWDNQPAILHLDLVSRTRTEPIPLRSCGRRGDIERFGPCLAVVVTFSHQHLLVVSTKR